MIDTRTGVGKSALAAALSTVAVGLLVLAGWVFHIDALTRIVPAFVAMNPVTATGLILAGLSLAFALRAPAGRRDRSRRFAARASAFAVLLIGVGLLFGLFGGRNEQLTAGLLADGSPRPIAFNSMLNFLLLGSALPWIDSPRRPVRLMIQACALVVGLGALLTIVAYAYDVQSFYHVGGFTPMALHTGVGFGLLAVGMLLSHSDRGLLAVFAGDGAGGTIARRLLPAALLAPAVLGWLVWQGELAGLFHDDFGDALGAIANIVVFTLLVAWSARELSAAESARRTAETRFSDELRWKTAFLEAQVNSSIDGVLVVDEHGRKLLQNQRAAELLRIPSQIASDPDDNAQLQWVQGTVQDPVRFMEKVQHLNTHKDEVSFDEIRLVDETVLDRYSSPVRGVDGEYYGRIWTFRDITAPKRAEIALRQSEERFRNFFELGLIGMAISTPDKGCLAVNDRHCEILGYERAELLRMAWDALTHPDDLAEEVSRFNEVLAGVHDGYSMEKRYIHRDGHTVYASISVRAVRRADRTVDYLLALVQDVSERKALEHQLFQSQKLETVGRLAGGIAHEFNSMLTAIIGHSEALRVALPSESVLVAHAAGITQAADRAAVLTRQLLAYGRKQVLRPGRLDLNAMLARMDASLRHVAGRSTEVRVLAGAGLHPVKADDGQIEQVVMNMAINAADAMPRGGTLTLETSNVVVDAEFARTTPDLNVGDYVLLAITDTGVGMTDRVKAHLFEPFFTTKEVGQGTGLGLSTCYGIVRQSGGHITVTSAAGQGTTFKIYLPQFEAHEAAVVTRLDSADLPRGSERILLIESDAALRDMAAALLQRLGYSVVAVGDDVEAGDAMPQGVPAADLIFREGVHQFTPAGLAQRIRRLLDAGRAAKQDGAGNLEREPASL